jgi:DNA-binding transcriptional MerR regulator
MLKISPFSKLSRVSVKTLRFYDDLGLLKPAVVDENNGYRYYSEEQLLTVKRIIAFKEQGFNLEQIMSFLKQDVSPEIVKTTLIAKQAELQSTILEARRQLTEIDVRLNNLEQSDDRTATYLVTIRSVMPQLVASIRDIIPRKYLCLLLDEVMQYVYSYGEDASRSLTILWHDCSAEEDQLDIEVALPILKEIPSSDRVNVGFLPDLKIAASLVHRCDPYDNSCPAITELASWITSHGYLVSDKEPIREIYLTSDKDIYGSLRQAELLIPVETA